MRSYVEFVLNGQPRKVDNPDPTQTVLRFLREEERLMGTKEGCAEGDCGACTAVVAELKCGEVHYKAINTCIHFLGMLDGKALLTVEYLKSGQGLHPVQLAMADTHASQCGFCTPGFVMSLFAGYQRGVGIERREIDDLLAGNLCRCTGYVPILQAARQALKGGSCAPDDGDRRIASALSNLDCDDSVHTKRAGRQFLAPTTKDELADLVEQYPDATLVAGATDAGLSVTKAHRRPATVIHLGKVQGLDEIVRDETGVHIGATATYEAVQPILGELYADIGELIRRIGGVQVRSVGTVGGNIANGSPIGDMPPALIAAGATVTLRCGTTQRAIDLEDYFIDYGQQDRREGEFLESIFVPAPDPDSVLKCYKISKRFDQDISAVCAVFSVAFDTSRDVNVVRRARLAFGGMAGTPIRARACEDFLAGKAWTEATVREAMALLDDCYEPMTDWRAGSDYRRRVGANLLRKFYLETSRQQPLRLAGRAKVASHAW